MGNIIPAGMEMFPATAMPSWDVIRSVIDSTDYYVLVLAGKYGSQLEDGRSYTEAEFDYALETEVPILAFLHASPGKIAAEHSDVDPQARKRMESFRAKVKTDRNVKWWSSTGELTTHVVSSLNQAIVARPRPGWERGSPPLSSALPTPEVHREPGTTANPVTPAHVQNDTDPRGRSEEATWSGNAAAERAPREQPPGRSIKSELNVLSARVLALPHLRTDSGAVAMSDGTSGLFTHRRREILQSSVPLLRAAAEAVTALSAIGSEVWADLIPDLDQGRLGSGDSDLLALLRAPSVFLFHAVGVAAASVGDLDTVGSLMSDDVEVPDLYAGQQVPAAEVLVADHVASREWPSRRLHHDLDEAIGSVLGSTAFDRGWQRWTYWHNAALVETNRYTAVPYLQVDYDWGHSGVLTVPIAKRARRLATVGASSLLSRGPWKGSAETFATACDAFEIAMARQVGELGAPRQSGPHYPQLGGQ